SEDGPDSEVLPTAIQAVAIRALSHERENIALTNSAPEVRLRTRSGHWLIQHASLLTEPDREQRIAVIMEVARPWEIAPVIVQAYGLTSKEREVAQLVMHGLSYRGDLRDSSHLAEHRPRPPQTYF